MPRNSLKMKTVFIFLLIFGILTKYCNSQTNGNDAHKPPERRGGKDGNAFFALRSCHQVMRGDSGEFSSPDYLCSNPPLWCNWTIHLEPGKRVNLFLEDLTPADSCHLKLDQIHIDEHPGVPGGHRFLQKCWREAKYTSLSNTLHVVLLIGGYPNPPYRGFYGRYQAFGPPIIYNPHDDVTEQDGKSGWGLTFTEQPLGQRGFTRFAPMKDGKPMETVLLEQPTLPSQENYDMAYEYYDQPNAMLSESPRETEEPTERDGALRFYPIQREEEGIQVHHQAYPSTGGLDGDVSHVTVMPTVMVATQGTSPSQRGVTRTPHLNTTGEDFRPLSSHKPHDGVQSKLSQRAPSTMRRNVDAQTPEYTSSPTSEDDNATLNRPEMVPSVRSSEQAEDGANGTRLHEASDLLHSPADAPTSDGSEGAIPRPHPNVVEPLSGNRGSGNARNYADIPHLPGDHLFEVAVEVNFQHEHEGHWDRVARALLSSTKTLIYEKLELLNSPKTMSSKRIKRLSAGVLFILWLQIGEGSEGPDIHRALHAALQGLIETEVSLRGSHNQAVIVSVSTADVNECGTQLVLCDINAECVNRFGSYTCICRPGFRDLSRVGLGGTLCVDQKAAGTDPLSEEVPAASYHSPEQQHRNPGTAFGCNSGLTKGVYVMFFLLSSLILLLLAAVGLLYHRHRRGGFLVPCHSPSFTNGPRGRAPDGNNDDGSLRADSDLPPPPPPIRRPKEGWSHPKDCCPAVDLPLLRFSPLMPLDAYLEREEGVKM